LEPRGIPRGTYLLTTSIGEVGFNRESDYWLDVGVFEKKIGQVLAQPIEGMAATDASELENTLELCTGELLEGFYDDWALRERERSRSLYLKSLSHLMRYYRHHKAYEKSLACGQQILSHDPLREEIHREVIRLYVDSGQRTTAIRQYETCCQILEAELGIPPMEETQALHTEIVKSAGDYYRVPSTLRQAQGKALPQALGSGTSREPASVQQAFWKLNLTMRQFDKTREQLQQAIKYLVRVTKGGDFPKLK
jgi:DNA-binding SARP family transcriptional activator